MPGKRVAYIGPDGRKVTDVFEMNLFRSAFSDTSKDSDFWLLSAIDDSVPQYAQKFAYLNISFADPAIIPKGAWNIIDTRKGKIKMAINYDDNGNAIKVTAFYKEEVLGSYQKIIEKDERDFVSTPYF